MSEDRSPDTRAEGGAPSRDAARAAFIARVTAGATHELRNFLAIVKESAGLVGDLVQAAGPGRAANPEKVEWALDRIRLQVRRGTDLTDSLNRVMHGLDHPTEIVELGTALEHATLLAQRFARRSQCRIRYEEGAALTVSVNALDLYMALMAVMEWCVGRLPPDGEVVARPEAREGRPAVGFATDPAGAALADLEDDDRRGLDAAAAPLPATIEVAGDSIFLVFTVEESL